MHIDSQSHEPPESPLDDQDLALAQFLRDHRRLFVLTGAGCSTASGLGDYRDQSGQWKRRQPITGQTFIENLDARRRYWARSFVGWPFFSEAVPNHAHSALVNLQQRGIARFLVTQNVDELHQKAGHSGVVNLHGVLSRVACIACGCSTTRDAFQQLLLALNPWLNSLSAAFAPDGDADLEIPSLQDMRLPACVSCSGVMKPEVVFFGENVPRETVELALHQLHSADALLVVGSSLMVFSGFRFCRAAAGRNQPIAIINDGITRADDLADLKVTGDCGQRLRNLVDQAGTSQR